MLAGELELTAMDGDDRDGKVVLRHLESVLDRDVVRAGGVLRRELPAPGPELDPRESPRARGRCTARRARATPAYSRSSRARTSSLLADGASSVHDRVGRLLHQLRRRRRRSRDRRARVACAGASRVARHAAEDRVSALSASIRSTSSSSSSASSSAARACSRALAETDPEARRPREPAVDERLKRRARGRLAKGFLEQVRQRGRRPRARRGGRGPRRATSRSPSRPAGRSRSSGRASTPRQRDAHELRPALDDGARPARPAASAGAPARRARLRRPTHLDRPRASRPSSSTPATSASGVSATARGDARGASGSSTMSAIRRVNAVAAPRRGPGRGPTTAAGA